MTSEGRARPGSARRLTGILTAMLAVVAAMAVLLPGVAHASHYQPFVRTCFTPVPKDPGGCDARARLQDPDDDLLRATVDFHAYDERLVVFDRIPDGRQAVAKVRYVTSNQTYRWEFASTAYNVEQSHQLGCGGDCDLNENNRIYIQICLSADGECTPEAQGVT